MKVILKYILNNVKERMLRTSVMVLSIILSTSLLFVSMSIGDSYETAQLKMARGFAGPATVSVSVESDADGNTEWITEKEIPQNSSIKNKVGILTTSALYENDGYFENFDLIAANLNTLNEINKPKLQDDTTLTNFSGYRIVTTEKFAGRYGLEVGDDLVLNIGGRDYKFQLNAIADYDTVFLRQSRGFNALVPKETLAEILKASDGYSKIMIVPSEGVNSNDLKQILQNSMPEGYQITQTYDENQVTSDAQQKSLPFYLISFFSFIMSIFIIFSSYKVITMERLPIIGTFRSIGATKQSTTWILLLESLVYGITGGLIGIPVGYGVLKLILVELGKSLSIGIKIPMVVRPMNIAISFFVAFIVSLLSAYIPIRRASKIPIKDVVLGTVDEKVTSNKVKLTFGVIVFVISLVLPLTVDKEKSNLLMASGGISLLGFIIATIIITPLITNTLSVVLEYIFEKILGNEGKLAARNMRDNKNIAQNITLLFISLSSVIVISTVSSFAISYLGDVYGGGTLDGFASGDMSPEFIEEIENFDGMEDSIPIYEMDNKISVNSELFGRMEAVDNLNSLCNLLNIKIDDETTKKKAIDSFKDDRVILISKDCMKQRKFKNGDMIPLDCNGMVYNYQIIGVYQSRGDNSEAIISGENARTDFGAVNYGKFAYSAVDPDAIMAQIRNLFGNKYNWSRTVEEYSKDATQIISSFMDPMKKLTYFILLLATVGIINNLLINYIQKKRSIAMYKSIGLSNRQTIKMTMIEGITSGLIGTIIGIVAAYMEIKTIFIVAGPKIAVVPEYDVMIFITTGIAGVLITVLGSVAPILKSSGMKLVEEIKFE